MKSKSSGSESVFETHKDKIYPWVKVTLSEEDEDPVQIELDEENSPIQNEWLGDLVVLYVADVGDRFEVLLERDLPNDISKEDLHELAVENLGRDVEFTLRETNFGGHGLIAGGNHEAAAICLPDMWEWLAEHLEDNLIVGIPSKDLVMMVPESEEGKINDLKNFVQEIFEDGERLLTKNIFKYDREAREWSIVDTVE